MNDEPHDSKEDFEGYFKLMAEFDAVCAKFMAQPWVKAVRAKREVDNRNRIPMDGRTYPVTQIQYVMTRTFFNRFRDNDVRLLGYSLIPGDN